MTESDPLLGGGRGEARFRRLYAEHGRELMAYALRRTTDAEDAADVFSETFLVAWRRADEVPPGDEALHWLIGVARRVLSNQRRGERRRLRLTHRLRHNFAIAVEAGPDLANDEDRVRSALRRLGPDDREILRLTAWEGLSPAQAARVLGISAVAARSRLHRARRRLGRELDRVQVDLPATTEPRTEER